MAMNERVLKTSEGATGATDVREIKRYLQARNERRRKVPSVFISDLVVNAEAVKSKISLQSAVSGTRLFLRIGTVTAPGYPAYLQHQLEDHISTEDHQKNINDLL